MRVSIQFRIAVTLSVMWLGGANVARSQNVFDFTGAGGDSLWNNPANWTGGPAGTFPNGADDTARFIGQTANVVLNIPVTAHLAVFGGDVSISGTGSLTLPPASAPQVLLEVGILEIGVPTAFSGPTTFIVNTYDFTGTLGLTFLEDIESNLFGLTIVSKDPEFATTESFVTFQGNYNTGDVYVDGPALVHVQQTFNADAITIDHGFMRAETASANIVANHLTLRGGVFSESGADNSLSNVTGPVVSQGGLFAGGFVVPGLHVQKGYTFISTFGAGQQMQLGDVTRDLGGTMNLFIGGGTSVVADSVEGAGPGGVVPWITESGTGNNYTKSVGGALSALTDPEYHGNINTSTATDATRVLGLPTLTGDAEAFVAKVDTNAQLNGANNSVSTNAWLAGSNSRISNATLMPLNSDELLFLAPIGSSHLTLSGVNVVDTPAGPTKVIFSGAGQFTINDSWSKTGDTCAVGPVKLNLNANADLGGNMLTLLSDSDGFIAHDVRLNGAMLTQHVHVQPSPLESMFTIQGNSTMTGNMTIEVNSANQRGVNLLVQAGASLTHSGTITRSGTGNPIAGQGQATVRVSGEGAINFAASFDSTNGGLTTILSGSNGQNVVVDGSLGETVIGDEADVQISGGGTIGGLADRVTVVDAQFGLAPGSSIGTLTVESDMLIRNADFIYEAEVTDTGQSDRLAVGGTLDLSTPGDTLDISFFAGTTLADANYTLATYGALVGTFDAVRFSGAPIADPTAPGAFGGTHQLIYGASALLLATGPVVGVPGDYNNDGKVDAADYVLWRKNPDSFGGDPGGYNTWRANFGMMAGVGSGAGQTVPEPATLWPIAAMAAGLLLCRAPRFRHESSNTLRKDSKIASVLRIRKEVE